MHPFVSGPGSETAWKMAPAMHGADMSGNYLELKSLAGNVE